MLFWLLYIPLLQLFHLLQQYDVHECLNVSRSIHLKYQPFFPNPHWYEYGSANSYRWIKFYYSSYQNLLINNVVNPPRFFVEFANELAKLHPQLHEQMHPHLRCHGFSPQQPLIRVKMPHYIHLG